MKLARSICLLILTAAPALAWRRHDSRTVKDLALTYTGLAVVLACDIPRRKKEVTDRQHRQRSRACIDPALLKRCGFCGSSRNMRVHHLNGDEADEDPKNLIGACHACNTQIGFLLKRHNIGRRVDLEYNPPAQPARNLAQWMMAVKSMHGESNDMTPRQAIAMIRATSPNRRSHFADDIWKLRRARGTDRTAVPF
jgi:hypothetical protein